MRASQFTIPAPLFRLDDDPTFWSSPTWRLGWNLHIKLPNGALYPPSLNETLRIYRPYKERALVCLTCWYKLKNAISNWCIYNEQKRSALCAPSTCRLLSWSTTTDNNCWARRRHPEHYIHTRCCRCYSVALLRDVQKESRRQKERRMPDVLNAWENFREERC